MNIFLKFTPPWRGKQTNKGFTLLETLVAISIFTASILGMMSVLASGISNTTYAKQKIAAEYLAQEGIEYARNQRDNVMLDPTGNGGGGWNGFRNPSNNVQLSAPSGSGFTRTVSKLTEGLDPNEVKITSTVTWTQGSGPKSIVFTENLFNWVE